MRDINLTAMALDPAALRAAPGDHLVVRVEPEEPALDAEVLQALGAGGGPPYLVRWEAYDYVSRLYPAEDLDIEHQSKRPL